MIVAVLKQSGLLPESSSSTGKTLHDVPPAVVYHMLSDIQILQDQRVNAVVHACVPKGVINGWPHDVPPAGLFLLLMDEGPAVRTWAHSQIAIYTTTPMQSEHFLPMYSQTLELATAAVTSRDIHNVSDANGVPVHSFTFTQDPLGLWSGYSTLLRFVPKEWFKPSGLFQVDLGHVIVSHLSATGTRSSIYLF